MYWTKEKGDLAKLIEKADTMTKEELNVFGSKAKLRVENAYSWKFICDKYEKEFMSR